MRKQAERWGTELKTEDVEYVDTRTRPFTVRTSECEVPKFLMFCYQRFSHTKGQVCHMNTVLVEPSLSYCFSCLVSPTQFRGPRFDGM